MNHLHFKYPKIALFLKFKPWEIDRQDHDMFWRAHCVRMRARHVIFILQLGNRS